MIERLIVRRLEQHDANDFYFAPVDSHIAIAREIKSIRDEARKFLHDSRNFSLSEVVEFLKHNPYHFVMVRNKDGKPLGYLRLLGNIDTVTFKSFLIGLDLKKEFRGVGLGQRILGDALEWIARGETSFLVPCLEVLDFNYVALRLYQKLGFKIVSVEHCVQVGTGRVCKSIKMELPRNV